MSNKSNPKRRRKFKRVIPFERADLERVLSVQLNVIEPERVSVVFKQGCLTLSRDVITRPGDLDKLSNAQGHG